VKKVFYIIGSLFVSSLYAEEKELSMPITDLGSLIEPDPIKFSFETTGWYVLLILIIISISVLFYRWLKKYQSNAYRREALKEITNFQKQPIISSVDNIMILLKKVAMHAYGRQEVASLTGETWYSYLESKGKNTAFMKIGQRIAENIYEEKPMENKTLDELVVLSKRWIKTHA